MKKLNFKLPRIRNPVGILDMVAVVTGIILIGKGLYMVYPPLMYIIIGTILAFPGWPKKEVKK